MMLISPILAIAVFTVILSVAFFISWKTQDHSKYQKSRVNTFLSVVGGLAIIMTFLFYYNLIQLQNQQQVSSAYQELSHLNGTVISEMNKEIKKSSEIIPNFVLSISPLTREECKICPIEGCGLDEPSAQVCTAKMVLSSQIFYTWQYVISGGKYIRTNRFSYLVSFLQKANSPQLFNQWKILKINYNEITQTFGDLLFEYGIPVRDQTVESYVKRAEKLSLDPRYIKISKLSKKESLND